MDQATRTALIARYKDGPRAVEAALDGLADAELDRRAAPDDWTVREIVHHLADSELTLAARLRLLVAEDAPQIAAFDEQHFARRLHYDRPIATSLATLRAARASTGELLGRLAEADWARAGTHTVRGHYSVEDWLSACAEHAHDHAEQIRRARGAAG
jgi:hypothetical protein